MTRTPHDNIPHEVWEQATNWEEEFLKTHYEPEHERGQTCWCRPVTLVKEGTPHIEHHEQRVILVVLIRTLLEQARQAGRDEAVEYILEKGTLIRGVSDPRNPEMAERLTKVVKGSYLVDSDLLEEARSNHM